MESVYGNNVFNYAFSGCSNLTEVKFGSLHSLGYNPTTGSSGYAQFKQAFVGCPKLKTLSFPSLERIYTSGGTTLANAVFYQNTYIERIDLPKLNLIDGSGASHLFDGCTALTEIHFGAENQQYIESHAGYSTLWGRGAGSATVYFDL